MLGLVGVPRSEIVDYLATREALPVLRPRLAIDEERVPDIEHLLDVSVPAVTAVLDDVGDDLVAFHRPGVDPHDIRRWCHRVRPMP